MKCVQLKLPFIIGPDPENFSHEWMRFFASYCYSEKPLPLKYASIRYELPFIFVEESIKQGNLGLNAFNINKGLYWEITPQGYMFWQELYHLIQFYFIEEIEDNESRSTIEAD